MLKFASMENGKGKYPRQTYDGQDNQSYNFVPANKLQTGNLRGTQGVGYGSVKIDGANNRITVGTNSASVVLGDISDLTDDFGFSVSDASNIRLLAGKYPDGEIHIKLSQTGYDVTTATDNQLIWSSDFNSFKIVDVVDYTFPVVSIPGTGTEIYQSYSFAHEQITVPIIQVYGLKNASNFGAPETAIFGTTSIYVPMYYNTSIDSSVNTSSRIYFGANSVNVVLGRSLLNFTGGALNSNLYTVKVYILAETTQ